MFPRSSAIEGIFPQPREINCFSDIRSTFIVLHFYLVGGYFGHVTEVSQGEFRNSDSEINKKLIRFQLSLYINTVTYDRHILSKKSAKALDTAVNLKP